MSKSNNGSESILPAVAKHERELLARVRESEEEAQRIVETARSDARAHREQSDSQLADEVAEIRRAADEKRHAAFQVTVDAASASLVTVRETSQQRIPATTEKVMALFVPGNGGGSHT